MSEIDWDLAPEGAVAIKMDMSNHLYWVDSKNVYWDVSGEGWANCTHHTSWQTLATRPQTKTVADSSQASCSEGEKWTHTYYNNLCLIVAGEPDRHGYIAIKTEKAGYQAVDKDAVKLIKPKLTKAEAWDRCMEEFGVRDIKYVMQELMNEFEII